VGLFQQSTRPSSDKTAHVRRSVAGGAVNCGLHIILNPTAGSGAGRKLQQKVAEAAAALWGSAAPARGQPFAFHVTARQGEATELARNAVAHGATMLIVCGGDGTVQEVVNGMLSAGIGPVTCELGIVNCGTGRGLADSLDLPASLEEQLSLIHSGDVVPLDVGRARYVSANGGSGERFFVNECQLGIGGAVVARIEADRDHRGETASVQTAGRGLIPYKRLGGTLAFGLVAVEELVRLRCPELTVQIDDDDPIKERFLGIIVGNGAKCGGGMRLTPNALPDDGLFDVVLVREMNVPRRLWAFPKIYKGRHTGVSGITSHRARRITVTGSDSAALEADGELLGASPCTIEVVPAALRVRARRAGEERVRER
jgi:diacylglycerol kinase (ATP)